MSAIVRHCDIDAWARLAELACDIVNGERVTLARLRAARDDTNRAVMLGGTGPGAPCPRLRAAVNRRCDPTDSNGPDSELFDAACDVLVAVSVERELLKAGRRA